MGWKYLNKALASRYSFGASHLPLLDTSIRTMPGKTHVISSLASSSLLTLSSLSATLLGLSLKEKYNPFISWPIGHIFLSIMQYVLYGAFSKFLRITLVNSNNSFGSGIS